MKKNSNAVITPSSANKQGKEILDLKQTEEDLNSNVSREEEDLLERTVNSMGGEEDLAWEEASLDNEDEDGELLNEVNEYSGKDLDVPGAETDDRNEEIGAEDEENNSYSLGGDKKD